ncbi:hypothetical protein F5888DRAFT_1638128 [Russula emetica]|nr:hypothetical protein F5888DRAFT_1638128 [Russula emetica]
MTCVSGELNQPVTVTRRATATESLHRTPPLANTSLALAPARRTEQMGVNLHAGSTSTTGNNNNNNGPKHGTSSPKKKYAVSDLPFAHWDVDSRKWRTSFIPSLLAWAGTQGDPFGANSQMTDEVTALWQRLYLAIVLNDARTSIVLSVCENTLNNWRSDIGKAGHRAILELWLTRDPRFDTTQGRAEYIGAIALATIAVERGLMLFKSGEDALKADRESVRAGSH